MFRGFSLEAFPLLLRAVGCMVCALLVSPFQAFFLNLISFIYIRFYLIIQHVVLTVFLNRPIATSLKIHVRFADVGAKSVDVKKYFLNRYLDYIKIELA